MFRGGDIHLSIHILGYEQSFPKFLKDINIITMSYIFGTLSIGTSLDHSYACSTSIMHECKCWCTSEVTFFNVCKFYFRETMQRVKELVQFGGFSDCEYLQRTLAKEFQQMEDRYVFIYPYAV
jgi:hypothetical protein